MIQTIRQAIYDKLNTLVSVNPAETDKPITALSDFFIIAPDGFPFCMFEFEDDTWEVFTDQENERTVSWRIILRQEYASDDNSRETALNTILDVYEKVIDLLDTEWNFEWTEVYSKPANAKKETVQTENWFEIDMDIILDTVIITNA